MEKRIKVFTVYFFPMKFEKNKQTNQKGTKNRKKGKKYKICFSNLL